MNELDPTAKYDPTFLFIRSDERTQSVEAEQHDMRIELQDVKNQVAALDGRVNQGVSRTGNENKTEIATLKTQVALLERENGDMKSKLFDKDTGLVKQFETLRNWQSHFNNTVTAFFVTGVAGGLFLWAFKNFR